MTSIESYQDKWQEPLFEFFGEFNLVHYQGQAGEERWRWRRQKGVLPWFDKMGFPLLCVKQNEVLGIIDAIPNLLAYGDRKFTSITFTDYYVRKSERGVGVFLVQKAKHLADISTCTNGPPEVLDIFAKLGFEDLGNGHRAWQKRLMSPGRAFLKKLSGRCGKRSGSVELPGGWTWFKTRDMACIQNIGNCFETEWLKSFRSSDYLNWRLLEQPGQNFEMWVCKDSSGVNTAYCIFKKIRRRAVMPYQAIIYDFGFDNSRSTDEKNFIESVEQLLLGLGCDVTTFFLISPWEVHLRNMEYELVWEDRFLQISKGCDIPEHLPWHLTLLDTEKFLYLK